MYNTPCLFLKCSRNVNVLLNKKRTFPMSPQEKFPISFKSILYLFTYWYEVLKYIVNMYLFKILIHLINLIIIKFSPHTIIYFFRFNQMYISNFPTNTTISTMMWYLVFDKQAFNICMFMFRLCIRFRC